MLVRAVIAALALALLPLRAQADTTFTGTLGGPGGGDYDIRCPLLSYVSGITTNSGYWLDGVTVHCGFLNPASLPNRVFEREVAPASDTDHAGGPGGTSTYRVTCGPEFAVNGIEVYNAIDPDGTFVAYFRLHCQRMNPPYDTTRSPTSNVSSPASAAHRYAFAGDLYCPDRSWAIGVYGKAGLFVDSIGLVCQTAIDPPAPPVSVAVPLNEAVRDPSFLTAFQEFPDPSFNGFAVDICLNWGTNCGQPAADAFCQSQGYAASVSHEIQNDAPPTLVIGDGVVCEEGFCDRFSSITCQ